MARGKTPRYGHFSNNTIPMTTAKPEENNTTIKWAKFHLKKNGAISAIMYIRKKHYISLRDAKIFVDKQLKELEEK